MLPSDDGPVGIIAGGHDLPLEIAQSLRQQGRDYCLFGILGEADNRIEAHPHLWIGWGQISTLLKELQSRSIGQLLFVGSITKRPDFHAIKLELGTVKLLPEILGIVTKGGDEGVLGGVAGFFEKRGFALTSVPEIAPDLTVGPHLSVSSPMLALNSADIEMAAKAAYAVGLLDAGQGAVVAGGRILALEGPEGTDQMLDRVAAIRRQKRARWNFGKQGVLLKRARPGQDLRFDMPTIGPRTVEKVAEAGLAGIVCPPSEVLCVNRAKTEDLTRKSGLFLSVADLTLSG